jgi:glycosyltransferase involved in cell wall biosynthesis
VRIAQVAPLFESVPPKLYGGTERIVSYLTEELHRQGHQVTLFASGDSLTRAKLVSVWPTALRLDRNQPEPVSLHVLEIEAALKRSWNFDVIHFHIDAIQLPLARRQSTPVVTTLHGRLDLPGLSQLYAEFRDMPLVSISHFQRAQLPDAPWVDTVHHGLPVDLHHPSFAPGDYLAFLGRISPEKGPDRAIAIARASGIPLRIAAKVDRADQRYYEKEIAPRIDGRFIRYEGELSDARKGEFLRGALALLFPIDWPEPFGVVMIEAMACGTPVIAFRAGSVPEVIEDGVSGRIVDGIDAAVACVAEMAAWDRKACRAAFERRFTAQRMAMNYTRVYENVRRREWSRSG